MKSKAQNKTIPPVWIFSLVIRFRDLIKKLYYKLVPANVAVFEMAERFWLSKSLAVACELNLAEIIGDDGKTTEAIAAEAGTDANATCRLLRALAGEGVFAESRPGFFVNNRLSDPLRGDSPNSVKHMIMHQLNQTNWEIVNGMKTGIISGKNVAREVLGTDIFSHLANHPEKNELYNKAMSETSRLSSPVVVSAYDFSGIGTLADLGGGEGELLFSILLKYRKLRGILFDLPHVAKPANNLAKSFGVDDRVQVVTGSFFKDPIPPADAYLLKNIVHMFDDETSIRLLKSIAKSMSGKGKILLVETVVSGDNRPAFGKMLDLQMLVASENGRERTQEQFRKLLEASGFRLNRVVPTVSPFSIVEGVKT